MNRRSFLSSVAVLAGAGPWPYAPSTAIRGLRWLTTPQRYNASRGDVWTCTWADDGNLYAALL